MPPTEEGEFVLAPSRRLAHPGRGAAFSVSATGLFADRFLYPVLLVPDLARGRGDLSVRDTMPPTKEGEFVLAPSRRSAHPGRGAAFSVSATSLSAGLVLRPAPLASDLARGREACSVRDAVPPTEEGEFVLAPSRRSAHPGRGTTFFTSATGLLAGRVLRPVPLAPYLAMGRGDRSVRDAVPPNEEGEFVLAPRGSSCCRWRTPRPSCHHRTDAIRDATPSRFVPCGAEALTSALPTASRSGGG